MIKIGLDWCLELSEEYEDLADPEESDKVMEGMPRRPFAPWHSFRGKCIAYCEIIPDELRDESYEDMEPDKMLDYADRLEVHANEWEQNNPRLFEELKKNEQKLKEWKKDNDWKITIGMDEARKNEYQKKMREKYGDEFMEFVDVLEKSDLSHYDVLKDAITWLRYWGNSGYRMIAWY